MMWISTISNDSLVAELRAPICNANCPKTFETFASTVVVEVVDGSALEEVSVSVNETSPLLSVIPVISPPLAPPEPG